MQPILNIDLTTRETSEFTIPNEWTHDYLGAASLAARVLFDTLIRNIDIASFPGDTGTLFGFRVS